MQLNNQSLYFFFLGLNFRFVDFSLFSQIFYSNFVLWHTNILWNFRIRQFNSSYYQSLRVFLGFTKPLCESEWGQPQLY